MEPSTIPLTWDVFECKTYSSCTLFTPWSLWWKHKFLWRFLVLGESSCCQIVACVVITLMNATFSYWWMHKGSSALMQHVNNSWIQMLKFIFLLQLIETSQHHFVWTHITLHLHLSFEMHVLFPGGSSPALPFTPDVLFPAYEIKYSSKKQTCEYWPWSLESCQSWFHDFSVIL